MPQIPIAPENSIRRSLAFTVIELLVTLTIVSLLTASALLTVRLPLRQAELELAVEQIRAMDSLARDNSSKGQAVTLRLLPAEGRLVLRAPSGELLASQQLASNTAIARIVVLHQPSNSGAVELSYNRRKSATFAVLVGKSSRPQRWLLICGMSGESYRFDRTEGDGLVTTLFAQNRHFAN